MSEADSLLRERPGAIPFYVEDDVLIYGFKVLFSSFILAEPAREGQFKDRMFDFQRRDPLYCAGRIAAGARI